LSALFRSAWFSVVVLAYVWFASIEARPTNPWSYVLLLLVPLALGWVFRKTPIHGRPEHRDADTARLAARAATGGTLLFLVARTGPLGQPGFEIAAVLGTATALVAGLVALARFPETTGLFSGAHRTRALDAAGFAAVLFSIPLALAFGRATIRQSVLSIDPVTVDYATTTASIAGILLGLAQVARVAYERRLELLASDRARASLIVAITAGLFALAATLLELLAPDRALPAAILVSSLFFCLAALSPNVGRLMASLRAALVIVVVGCPLILLGATLARHAPERAPWFVLATGLLGLFLGLLARRVARPLTQEQLERLHALTRASEAALMPHPEEALAQALAALTPEGSVERRAELWQLAPPRVLFVDLASHLHTEPLDVPPHLVDLARNEPEATLRREVLEATQIRNPATREALGFFQTRRVVAATLLHHEEGPVGLLTLPEVAGGHTRLSSEEAEAMRRLAERLAAVVSITADAARARERELAALDRIRELQHRLVTEQATWTEQANRERLLVERLAHHTRRSLFSPSAVLTEEQLRKLARTNHPVRLKAPPGTDALGWAAMLHLMGPREHQPFLVLDATTGDLPDDRIGQWIAAASHGTMVLLHPQLLPRETLGLLELLLAEQQARSDAVQLVVVTAGQLEDEPKLMFWPHAEHTLELPSLARRPDDLRSMIFDRLARFGIALRGEPYGIEPAALRELLDHDWPHNELELDHTLVALLTQATSSPITVEHLIGIRFPLDDLPDAATDHRAPTPPRARSRSG